MMENKKILEEGLLERYLSGELTDEQNQMVESALEQDSSLRAHFDAMEADFERLGQEQAIAPPPAIKEGLIKTIGKSQIKKINWLPFSVAAGFAILFGLSTFWLYLQWQDSKSNITLLQSQTSELQREVEKLASQFELTSSRFENINNANVVPLVLYGNEKAPNSRAVAYVNHSQHLVFVNPKGLPTLPANKTYQMWSDVNGEMISMGTLSTQDDLIPLKYIENAESLNLTIEPAGGSEHPTVEALISNVVL